VLVWQAAIFKTSLETKFDRMEKHMGRDWELKDMARWVTKTTADNPSMKLADPLTVQREMRNAE